MLFTLLTNGARCPGRVAEFQRHEAAVRVPCVGLERTAVDETRPEVQLVRQVEFRCSTRFQAQAGLATQTGRIDRGTEQEGAHAAPQAPRRRTHRREFAM